MANNIKQVDNVNGSKMNLGQIEIAAIRGVEQGLTQLKMLDVTTQTDTAAEALNAGDAGKLIVIPNVGQDSVYSLPAPEVGLHFHIVGFGALAADGHDVSFHTNTLNTDFFATKNLPSLGSIPANIAGAPSHLTVMLIDEREDPDNISLSDCRKFIAALPPATPLFIISSSRCSRCRFLPAWSSCKSSENVFMIYHSSYF